MQKIDMHGIRHEKVSDVLAEACSTYDIPFIVVTGRSILMKAVVAQSVEQFGLKARDHITNPGRVVVYEPNDL
jgi:hypothetical protein